MGEIFLPLVMEISLKCQHKNAMKGDDKYAYVRGSLPEESKKQPVNKEVVCAR